MWGACGSCGDYYRASASITWKAPWFSPTVEHRNILYRSQWFRPPIIAWYIFLVMLLTSGFILWPLGPFDLFSTCNKFTVRFFKATGHIRLYWRNLVNTDLIFRLVSCRDISSHCLWKLVWGGYFPFRSWTTLKIDYLCTKTVMIFFFLFFFFTFSAGQIGVKNVQEENGGMSKIFLQEIILPCDLSVFICLTLHLFFPP